MDYSDGDPKIETNKQGSKKNQKKKKKLNNDKNSHEEKENPAENQIEHPYEDNKKDNEEGKDKVTGLEITQGDKQNKPIDQTKVQPTVQQNGENEINIINESQPDSNKLTVRKIHRKRDFESKFKADLNSSANADIIHVLHRQSTIDNRSPAIKEKQDTQNIIEEEIKIPAERKKENIARLSLGNNGTLPKKRESLQLPDIKHKLLCNPKTPKNFIDEDEIDIIESYKKHLENRQITELEQFKVLNTNFKNNLSAKNEERDPFGFDVFKTIEIIQSKDQIPRLNRQFLERVQKNDSLHNILLQRSEKELKNLLNCDLALNDFFNTKEAKKVRCSLIDDSKFTPNIHLNYEERIPRRNSTMITPRCLTTNLIKIAIMDNLRGFNPEKNLKITAQNLAGTQGVNAKKLLKKFRLENKAKSDVTKYSPQPILFERERPSVGLNKKNSNTLYASPSLNSCQGNGEKNKFLGKKYSQKAITNTAEKKTIYKVNRDILKQREYMTNQEIMERRCKILLGEHYGIHHVNKNMP